MIKTTGALIFRIINKNVEFLILKSYNNYDFPKGKMEENESHIDAAKREIFEETNLNDISFVTEDGKKIFIETEPYGKEKKIARFYLCKVSIDESNNIVLKINDEIGKPEHDKWSWLEYKDANKILNNRLKNVLNWAVAKLGGQ